MKKHALVFGLLIIFCSCSFTINAQNIPSADWSDKKVKKWFKKKEWLGGLQIMPHKTVSEKEFAKQYRLNKKYWDEAFAYLKTQDLNTIEKGKHVIDGENVYASVTIDSTKDLEKTNWESHRQYIDLQCVISGEEKIAICPVDKATVTKEYNEKRDVANYSAEGKFYSATPGFFFLFFPSEAHRPNITPGGNKPDKKIVIKVRYAG